MTRTAQTKLLNSAVDAFKSKSPILESVKGSFISSLGFLSSDLLGKFGVDVKKLKTPDQKTDFGQVVKYLLPFLGIVVIIYLFISKK